MKKLISRLKELIPRGISMYTDKRMPVYSGYATLYIVTAIFPLIMLIISIVNLLPGYSAKDVADILFKILPDLGPIKQLVESLMLNLKAQSGGLLASAAAVTTLWAASRGVAAIQSGLNELEPEKTDPEAKRGDSSDIKMTIIVFLRGILKQLIFTLLLVILVPALLVFEMLGDSLVSFIRSILEKLSPEGMSIPLSEIGVFFHISSLVVIVFALLVILQIFAKLPTIHRPLKSQIPGALIAGVCCWAFTKLFSFFIPRFYHASRFYGSLASLFLLLLWLRFMVMILFGGAVINRTIEEAKRENAI